jgi:penicillin-binding protein 1C
LLHDAGLRPLAADANRSGLTLAVGGIEASPLEVAEAYACLGRGGLTHGVSVLQDQRQSQPAKRALRTPACDAVLAAISARDRTAALSDDAARLGVAWKTGTSSGQRDAWCAALTPRRVVIVWVGDPQGRGDAAFKGIEAAAPLALRLIASIDPGGPPFQLPPTFAADAEPTIAVTSSASAARIGIVSPAGGQQIVLTSEESAQCQRFQVHAQVATDAAHEKLFWFVDGQPVATPADDPTRLWWSPTVGRHVFKIVTEQGDSASVDVRVVDPFGI